MATFCRRVCQLTGRQQQLGAGDPLLASPNGAGAAAAAAQAATRAARRGLKQINALCRQCDALAPVVQEALATSAAGSVAGQVQLSSIRSRLEDLAALLVEAQSEAEEAAAKTRPGVREVVQCIAAPGIDAALWRSGRVTLSDAGLEFEAGQGQSPMGDVQLVPWGDVSGMEMREPTANGPSSRMYEAQLELSRPPGRLRLQFGNAQPIRWLDALWKASSGSSGGASGVLAQVPGVEAYGSEVAQSWLPVLREYEQCGWRLPTEMHHVQHVEMPCQAASVASIHEELERMDGDSALIRLWTTRNVTELTCPAWAPLGGGLARCLSLRLPLKPIPMAPKSSRLHIFYHLTGGAESTELAWMTKSLDVPYANSFVLMGKFVFSGQEGGTVADGYMGWLWTGRCMIKKLIQSQSRLETAETCTRLAGLLCDALSPPAAVAGAGA